MKTTNIFMIVLALIMSCTSCSHFDDLNSNPDSVNKAPAAMMATSLILNTIKVSGGKPFTYSNMLMKQIAWGEGIEYYQYNDFKRTSFGGYNILTTGDKMVEVANDIDKDSYTALSKFVKAYKLFYLSMSVGDIPYSEALQGEEGNQSPKYDTQKEVMIQVLNDLDEAYTLFGSGVDFAGDPIYEGDVEKWKRCVRVFQLKVLTHLSKKESDTELDVKNRFAKIVAEGSLFRSIDDNFQIEYSDKSGQLFPFCRLTSNHVTFLMMSNMMIDNLKKFNDYRLFYYAGPAATALEAGISADKWEAYTAVDPSETFDIVSRYYTSREFCPLNERYLGRSEGEPSIKVGYGEQNFMLAEACLRGWISGDAVDYYKAGIKASMDFIVKYTPDEEEYHSGRRLSEDYISSYYATQTNIQLGDDFEINLEKIMMQRYLASFLQHPFDSYYDYRRTGYPVMPINAMSNLNTVKDKIPTRWMYPEDEFSFNTKNANEAVDRQYEGSDNVNKLMWLLK